MNERRYWIGVVPRDHADAAVANGVVKVSYGRAEPLARMQPGDGLVFYSPRDHFPDGDPLRAFTAIGRIAEGPICTVVPSTRERSEADVQTRACQRQSKEAEE